MEGKLGLRRRSDKVLARLLSVVMLQLAGQMLRAPKTRPLPDSSSSSPPPSGPSGRPAPPFLAVLLGSRPQCDAQGFELPRVQSNKTVTHTCGQGHSRAAYLGTGQDCSTEMRNNPRARNGTRLLANYRDFNLGASQGWARIRSGRTSPQDGWMRTITRRSKSQLGREYRAAASLPCSLSTFSYETMTTCCK